MPNPPEIRAGVRVWPETSFCLDGYDRVLLAGLGDAEIDWSKLQDMGVPQEEVVTLFGSLGSKRQAIVLGPSIAGRRAR